ncbi:MAG: hypothetical protein ACOCSD_06530 [Halolamina sp.]
MSTSKPSTPSHLDEVLPEQAATVAASLSGPLQATAFWSAVALPFVFLLLIATGTVWDRPVAFGALLALNALAFLGGHGYDPEPA